MGTAVFTERVADVSPQCTVVMTAGVNAGSLAENALKAAVRLWFVVAVIGQLMLAV